MKRRTIVARMCFGAALMVVGGTACTAPPPDPRPPSVPSGATIVFLVRHGEKASQAGDDPPLSEAGRALRDAGVTRVITTQWHRTQETAAPLTLLRGLPSTVIPVDLAHVSSYAQAVADSVRRGAGVTLVIGHQNTIPAVIAALGGPAISEICSDDYGDLFILVLAAPSSVPSLVHAEFGTQHPVHGTSCAAPAPAKH
jgi:phosphohistidine phosphatase SixA